MTELREITVGFLYVGPLSNIAQIMVASVRAAMPHARIVQMTDYATKPVTGVDHAIRKRWDGKTLMTYRLEHLKDFPPGDAVFLDADVVVQKDLAPLFEDEFDIGLTYRDATDPSLLLTPQAYETMPFNTGVVLSRASAPNSGPTPIGCASDVRAAPLLIRRPACNQGRLPELPHYA